jgi:hypothetical protein
MHRARAFLTRRPWQSLLPAALLALAVGCGELPAEAPSTPEPATPSGEGTRYPPSAQPSEARPSAAWAYRLGGPQDDVGAQLAVDGRAEVALVWLSSLREDADRDSVEGQRRALTLAKYGADGSPRWAREYVRVHVESPHLGASAGGELFLSGNASLHAVDFGLGAASDGFLVKFSEDGRPLWQQRVGQKVHALAVAADGRALLSAEEWTPEGTLPLVALHDAAGAYVWSRQLDVVEPGTQLQAVALAPSGQALLAGRLAGPLSVDGHTFGQPGRPGLVLLAFDAEGRLAWGRELQGGEGRITGLSVGPEGTAVLVGEHPEDLTWAGTTLRGAGAFVLGVGPDGSERWLHPLECGAWPSPPTVALEREGSVVAACGSVLSGYAPEGTQHAQRMLSAVSCPEDNCSISSTSLAALPGQGLVLTGSQRHGGPGADWDQEAFLRLLVPGSATP